MWFDLFILTAAYQCQRSNQAPTAAKALNLNANYLSTIYAVLLLASDGPDDGRLRTELNNQNDQHIL